MPVNWRGQSEMRDKLRRARINFPKAIGTALYAETQIEATEVKQRTPVWNPARKHGPNVVPGTLRASVRGTEPIYEGDLVYCLILAGGPQAPYAVYVHEDLDAFHATGQAKFIESVILESRPHMAARVAKRIQLRNIA